MEEKKHKVQNDIAKNPSELIMDSSKVVLPDIGFIIVAIGLSTIAIASGYGSPYLLVKIFSLVIYILAMWSAYIFYWHILFEKIPETMEKWSNKKSTRFPFKGTWWIFTHWMKLLFYTGIVLHKKRRAQTLECGYLTILLTIFLYWCAGIALYIIGFIELIN